MSIILFGNSITLLSGLGTIVVIAGVVLYNKVKQYEISRQLFNVSTNKNRHVSQILYDYIFIFFKYHLKCSSCI